MVPRVSCLSGFPPQELVGVCAPFGDPPQVPRLVPVRQHHHGTANQWHVPVGISGVGHRSASAPRHQTVVYSPSGLVRRDHPQTASAAGSREAVKIIVEEMVNPTQPLADLLMILDKLEWPTRPHPALNPHIEVLHPRAVLPLSVAFLARWIVCHLQSWRMIRGGRLPMRMPPPPTTRWAPRVTILVHPPGQGPSVLHLLRVYPEPPVILTLTSKVQPLLRALPGPMNTLAIRHHVLLWDASVVHTLATQDHFQ